MSSEILKQDAIPRDLQNPKSLGAPSHITLPGVLRRAGAGAERLHEGASDGKTLEPKRCLLTPEGAAFGGPLVQPQPSFPFCPPAPPPPCSGSVLPPPWATLCPRLGHGGEQPPDKPAWMGPPG